MVSLTQEMFVQLASNDACFENVHTRLIPTLCSILESPQTDKPDEIITVGIIQEHSSVVLRLHIVMLKPL